MSDISMSGNNREKLTVVETDVEITTPDGICDAAFFAPTEGTYPAVLLWPDAFSLRPATRGIGKRLASEGYAVLVPNVYYRAGKAPSLGLNTTDFNFESADDWGRLRALMTETKAPGTAEKDAAAYVAFLDAQRSVDTTRKIGTQGYCMGGALVFRTAASLPERVGAGASFHGGGLVTDEPDSPHRLIPKTQAQFYVGIASDDDERQPDAKDALHEAFLSANIPAGVEVYPALHGWCISDMPMQGSTPVYDPSEADKAWAKLLALYESALVEGPVRREQG